MDAWGARPYGPFVYVPGEPFVRHRAGEAMRLRRVIWPGAGRLGTLAACFFLRRSVIRLKLSPSPSQSFSEER
jgi:hypothetical protein